MLIALQHSPTLPPDDRLGVLTTTLPVVLAAPQVTLAGAQIATVAAVWAATPWPADMWDTTLHFSDGTARTVNWLALLDALNFCFWGEPGQPRWRIHWHDTWYDGYAALAAALSRAVTAGHPLWDAAYLAQMDATTLAAILRPDPDERGASVPIPLFAARLAHTRELGQALRDRFAGEFAGMVAAAAGDAVTLALLIAKELPSFHDVATWAGQEVRLFKRAQILVGDIATALAGTAWGTFANLGDLTAFADYKVPQLLRRLDMLTYAPDLAAEIDRLEELPAGSPAEVAIRAATVWGVELLRRELAALGVLVTAAAIDHRLWQAGQAAHNHDRPYHRTRTSAY